MNHRNLLPLIARSLALLTLLFVAVGFAGRGSAADWPTWRGDERRSGDWEGELAETLHLQWTRDLPPLEPAYRHPRLQFDLGYEPVLADDTLFIGSSRNDSVTAFDLTTGEQRWRFYASGPVRFAPVALAGKVYFGSDDGHLYCVDAADGELLWRFRAVPSDRKLLGNRRLISVWPVRGGPVIADDTIYFAAGVWSFEGVFVYALDAATGSVRWINDRAGFLYGQHPHDAKAFGGITPQGYLVVRGDDLVVPCGTALPAIFDRTSGKLKSFELPKAGRSPGGWFTAAAKAQRRGQPIPDTAEDDSDDNDDSLGDRLLFDAAVSRDRHEGGWHEGVGTSEVRSRVTLNGKTFDFTAGYPGVEGTIHSVLAGDGRLVIVTLEGRLHVFGPDPATPRHFDLPESISGLSDESEASRLAAEVLGVSGVDHGYAVVAGIDNGDLVEALASNSELHVIAFDRNADKCQTLRLRLDRAGLLGTRVDVHQGDPLSLGLPPYLASLVVSEVGWANRTSDESAADGEADFATLFEWLRPLGGVACLQLPEESARRLATAVQRGREPDGAFDGATLETAGALTVLRRPAALTGSTDYVGDWSSPDERVKAPLGVLWFDDSVTHFKRAPQPLIVDGVMISYDKDWLGYPEGQRPPYPLLPAKYSDVYTGRVLAESEVERVSPRLPTRDLSEKQPDQYRPPSQTDAWKPSAPIAGERFNPLTGQTEPRAIPKSYGCDGGVDYRCLYTLRSGTAAFYDKRIDSGTIHISGPRSGCTNSIIPANGLLNVPYFYQGCTCSYPLPVGLAMHSLPPEHEQWAVWGPGSPESIRRVGLNFGAPGVRMTEAGTLWLDYPRVGGPAPDVAVKVGGKSPQPFYRHSLWMRGGVGWPWVAASGLEGVSEIEVAGLTDDRMTIRLYFAEPVAAGNDQSPRPRVFDIRIQDRLVASDFEIAAEAGGTMRGVIKEFAADVSSSGTLRVELTAKEGEPLICGLELIATGLPRDEFTSEQ